MQIDAFKSDEDFILISNLEARFEFKTSSSISFDLVRAGSKNILLSLGWIDVHHPCEDHIRAQLKVFIRSDDLETLEQKQECVKILFDALSIPQDETYEALFISKDEQVELINHIDRDGMSNLIV